MRDTRMNSINAANQLPDTPPLFWPDFGAGQPAPFA
jgi:hypothetical protein